MSGEIVRLFNPRLDRWDEQFLVEPDDAIRGVSPIGRATVDRLNMNSERQINARRGWRILCIFP